MQRNGSNRIIIDSGSINEYAGVILDEKTEYIVYIFRSA